MLPSRLRAYRWAHAFMKNRVEDVFNLLMENPSIHDWNVIKHVRAILSNNQKQQVVDELDGIIKESEQLVQTINELLTRNNEIEFKESLTLISFYSDLNALDQAKQYYTRFIEEAERRNNQNLLVVALEKLGESEYKRSGHDGYKAAMAALMRAAEIRESETIVQKNKLKKHLPVIGLGLFVVGFAGGQVCRVL